MSGHIRENISGYQWCWWWFWYKIIILMSPPNLEPKGHIKDTWLCNHLLHLFVNLHWEIGLGLLLFPRYTASEKNLVNCIKSICCVWLCGWSILKEIWYKMVCSIWLLFLLYHKAVHYWPWFIFLLSNLLRHSTNSPVVKMEYNMSEQHRILLSSYWHHLVHVWFVTGGILWSIILWISQLS